MKRAKSKLENKIPSRPIHDALRESLKDIDIRFDVAPKSLRRDRFETANRREISVREFLESFFPPGWSVKKGVILDREGTSSAEVDCVLCVPDHPMFVPPTRQLILAEGVHAAVEVKPDLTSLGKKSEFRRVLDQCLTVKKLQRTIPIEPTTTNKLWPVEFHRIPYIVFAKKIAPLDKAIFFIDTYKSNTGKSPWDLPDIILGYDTGLIYHAPDVSICSLTPFFARNGITTGEAYLKIPMGPDSIILFLSLLHGFIFPRPLSRPILQDLLFPITIPPGMVLFQEL